ALALRVRLREAGFEPYVYDPRTSRPPAQVDEWDRMGSVWADIDTAGEHVNISHLRKPIERAAYVLLLDDALSADKIRSRHVQGEVSYASCLRRLSSKAPTVIGMPPQVARSFVFESGAETLRDELPQLRRGARPWLTLPRMCWISGLALAAAAVSAATAMH